jgi:hypothetical protein
MRELQTAVNTVPGAARWSPWFVLAGLVVIIVHFAIGLQLASVTAGYFAVPKPDRDAAQPGAAILSQLRYLQSTAAWHEPLKFLGVSLIIAGIALNLAAIIATLRSRAAVMQTTFAGGKGETR